MSRWWTFSEVNMCFVQDVRAWGCGRSILYLQYSRSFEHPGDITIIRMTESLVGSCWQSKEVFNPSQDVSLVARHLMDEV